MPMDFKVRTRKTTSSNYALEGADADLTRWNGEKQTLKLVVGVAI